MQAALEAIGITDARVQRWLGRDCSGCKRRKEKLNQLHSWAKRVVSGRIASEANERRLAKAREYLNELLEEGDE